MWGMSRMRNVAQLESDLVALRATAERAGTALACLFSSSDEFEAEVIRAKRAQGAFPAQHRMRLLVTSAGGLAGLAVLSFMFLMM
jgi:hypothetical protein